MLLLDLKVGRIWSWFNSWHAGLKKINKLTNLCKFIAWKMKKKCSNSYMIWTCWASLLVCLITHATNRGSECLLRSSNNIFHTPTGLGVSRRDINVVYNGIGRDVLKLNYCTLREIWSLVFISKGSGSSSITVSVTALGSIGLLWG